MVAPWSTVRRPVTAGLTVERVAGEARGTGGPDTVVVVEAADEASHGVVPLVLAQLCVGDCELE